MVDREWVARPTSAELRISAAAADTPEAGAMADRMEAAAGATTTRRHDEPLLRRGSLYFQLGWRSFAR